ncbi:MAG: formate dehydrogenase accessory sulfurtransferase FdhD [Candidatus Latescibacterota bacterium]
MKTEIEMLQIRKEGSFVERDVVATEIPLTVFLNDTEVATLLTSDYEGKSLAIGFLFSEGFLRHRDQLSGLFESRERKVVRVYTKDKQEPEARQGMITAGCGGGRSYAHYNLEAVQIEPPDDTIRIASETILSLMRLFQDQSPLFRETGGVHSCALADGDRIVLLKEDIGRHSAMDRVLGTCFLEDIPLEGKILLTSGRTSSEIVFKAGRGKFPILVSRSAPTDLAIQIAKETGIALVGFARGTRMNVYSHSERIQTVPVDAAPPSQTRRTDRSPSGACPQ